MQQAKTINSFTLEQKIMFEEYYNKYGDKQIHNCIRKVIGSGLNMLLLEDAVDAGWDGVIKAVLLYTPDRGALFSTYAMLSIIRSLDSMMRDKNRLKRNPPGGIFSIDDSNIEVLNMPDINSNINDLIKEDVREFFSVLNKFERKVTYYLMYGYEYSEIAKILNCSIKEVKAVKEITYKRTDVLAAIERLKIKKEGDFELL